MNECGGKVARCPLSEYREQTGWDTQMSLSLYLQQPNIKKEGGGCVSCCAFQKLVLIDVDNWLEAYPLTG